MPLEAGLPASRAFAFWAANLALRGKFRREKCNVLQKSLAETVLRVNIGKKNANLEEKSATYCKNLLQKWR